MSLYCSKTLDYVKGFLKMCEAMDGDCGFCPLCSIGCGIESITQEHIDAVQMWNDEHREKTNADVLLALFPNAVLDDICPTRVDNGSDCPDCSCEECRAVFWDAPYKQDDSQQIDRSEHPSVCDNCVYNPPSSGDGKPCTMCPAQSRHNDE